MSRYISGACCALLLLSVLLVLGLSFYVPIYSDDHAWPIVSSRGGYDGWQTISIWPLCSNNFGAPIPLSLLPGRFISSLAYDPISTPLDIKLFGIGRFAFWVAALIWACRVLFNVSLQRAFITATSLSFLGVLPFMATLMRPDPSISIAIAFYALLPFYMQSVPAGRLKQLALLAVCLLLSSWFFSAHPKTIFFFPLAFYAVYSLRAAGRWHYAGFAVLAVIVVQALGYWSVRLHCPDDPEFQRFYANTTLEPKDLLTSPYLFLSKFLGSVLDSNIYVNHMLFDKAYGSSWLPSIKLSAAHTMLNTALKAAVAAMLVYCGMAMARMNLHVWKEHRFLQPYFMVPHLLLAALVLVAGFQQIKSFYDVMVVWFTCCCLIIILLLHTPATDKSGIRRYILGGVAVVSFLSQLVLINTFWRLPDVSNKMADQTGFIRGQPLSSSVLNYDEISSRITTFAKRCGIEPESANRHLIVDMYTYLPYKKSYQPAFVKHMGERIAEFATSRGSSGLIARCDSLPVSVKNISIRDEGLCCIKGTSPERVP